MVISDKRALEIIDEAIKKFRGNSRKLSNAIGYLMIGRKFGWKIMYLMYDRAAIRDYEKILGISSKEFPDEGPLAHKSIAWSGLKKVVNFWKAVRGEEPGHRSTQIN
jgi:hypothetical protein